MGEVSKPEPINLNHLLEHFDSGEHILDDWLKNRALDNDSKGASRTFIIHEKMKVIAYYTLAVGSVAAQVAPGKIKRNMPNPIPVMVLGRLAVDKKWQNSGIGKGLLKDAVVRTVKVAQDAGIRALLIHAISESVKHFYKRFGFIESPIEPMILLLSLHNINDYFL